MSNSHENKIRLTLFITMWSFFVVIGVLTIAMLFFGFGTVQESEREVLFNVFVGEVLASIPALYYSIFKLKKTTNVTDGSSAENVDELKATIERKDNEIKELKKQLVQKTPNAAPNAYKYRNSIVALCSKNSDTDIDKIVEQHGLNEDNLTQERVKLISEIGMLKEEGVLVNKSVLNPTAVRLSNA